MKGDQRILVPFSAAVDMVFGKNSEDGLSDKSGTPEPGEEYQEGSTVEPPGLYDGVTEDVATEVAGPHEKAHVGGDVLARMSVRSGTRVRPPQNVSEVNGSVGGEKGWAERIGENEEMLEKRRQGLKELRRRIW